MPLFFVSGGIGPGEEEILEAAQERVAAERPGLVIPIADGHAVRAAGD